MLYIQLCVRAEFMQIRGHVCALLFRIDRFILNRGHSKLRASETYRAKLSRYSNNRCRAEEFAMRRRFIGIRKFA